jgi:nanoRNase/pAp phosphatase (c-di-AMP/oligoRNAs hydrolase)
MPLSPTDLKAATKAVMDAERLLIVPHANVDPDGLGSALACYSVFRAMGKDCTVICPETPPDNLDFLTNFEHLATNLSSEQEFIITLDTSNGVEVDKLRYTVEDNKVNIIVVPKKGRLSSKNVTMLEGGLNYDLIVVLDSAELSLLGQMYTDNIDLFSSIPVLNIDHHISNTRFGQLQLIDPTSASATEVLFTWFNSEPSWREFLSPDIATLLLTGLITDTRSFQNPNTTPKSLEIAASLLDLGARQQEIIQHIYKTKPLSTLKIWGRALNRIQIDPEARIVWSSVGREDLREMGAKSQETHGLLDELISTIPDADLHVLFTEVEEGGFKASLRSSSACDANLAAGRLFNGGGHARAAGFRMKNYGNFQLKVIECVQQLKEEILRQRREADVFPPSKPAPAVSPAKNIPQAGRPVKETAKTKEQKAVDVVQTIGPANKIPKTETDVVKRLANGNNGH